MESFTSKLWRSPARSPLIALSTAAIAITANHLIGQTGKVELSPTVATDILVAFGGLLFAVGGVAYSYWKRVQPMERIDWARKNGRLICPCTEIGTVMLQLPKPRSGAAFKLHECPVCKEVALSHQEIKTT